MMNKILKNQTLCLLILAFQSCTSADLDYAIQVAVAETLTAIPDISISKTLASTPTQTPPPTNTPPPRLDLVGRSLDYVMERLEYEGFVFDEIGGDPGNRWTSGKYKNITGTGAVWVDLMERQYTLVNASYGFSLSLDWEDLENIPHGDDFVLIVMGENINWQEYNRWTQERSQRIQGGVVAQDIFCHDGVIIYSTYSEEAGFYSITIMLERDWLSKDDASYEKCSK